jgi:hypothetical protein
MPDCIDALGTRLSPDVRADQDATVWKFCTGDEAPAVWDWSTGAPPYFNLGPVRRPRSTAKSKHAPVQVVSYTTGSVLWLESGLEADLVRALDRANEVVWMLPQPVELTFDYKVNKSRISHIPDLLTVDAIGGVTVWAVKAPEARRERFMIQASLTAEACEHVGLGYRLFGALPGLMRINLLWLNNHRRMMPWYEPAAAELRTLLGDGAGSVATVLDADQGSGHLVSTMWHLLWSGELVCDLTSQIKATTPVQVA